MEVATKTSSTPLSSALLWQQQPYHTHQQPSCQRSHRSSAFSTMLHKQDLSSTKKLRRRSPYHRSFPVEQIHLVPYFQDVGRFKDKEFHSKERTLYLHRPLGSLPSFSYSSSVPKVPRILNKQPAILLSRDALRSKPRALNFHKGPYTSPKATAQQEHSSLRLHRRLDTLGHIVRSAQDTHFSDHLTSDPSGVYYQLEQISAGSPTHNHLLRGNVEWSRPYNLTQSIQYKQGPHCNFSTCRQKPGLQKAVPKAAGFSELHCTLHRTGQVPLTTSY